ncbi:hypothetical protein CR513_21213, partial [Mucuna pruriens]
MADNLDDGEFWLPYQFLVDDDGDDTSFDNNLAASNAKNDQTLFPYLSSASETESDEEEHIAGLTRRVALELDLNSVETKPKGVVVSGSPQSTLSAFGSSGKGSPNGSVLSANSTWDLLRAAAGKVERIQLSEDELYGYSYVRNAAKPSPAGLGFYPRPQPPQPSLSQQQLQVKQFQMLRQQQHQRGMVPYSGRNNNVRAGNVGLSASAWSPLQHASGMRAVFLGNPSGKRESAGTGVFLPRCVDTRTESSKKPACSTVLIPDRVVHAMNLNAKGGHLQRQHQPRLNGGNGKAVSRFRNNNNNYYGNSHQKRNSARPQQTQVVKEEIQLPQEWTY